MIFRKSQKKKALPRVFFLPIVKAYAARYNFLMRYTFIFLYLFHCFAQAANLPTFADVAARAKLSVVNIRTNHSRPARKPRLDPYQFFLNEKVPISPTAQSLGSGVIVSSDGHILTNYHVVADAQEIEIMFANQKQKVQARVVGTDPATDLALLKTKLPKGVAVADLGDSNKLRVGDWVIAIGNPFGYEHTVTSGIISATGRVIGTGPYDQFLQTDAAINPGNSGGPLIDMRGRVIGINAAIDADAYGIGFATPVNIAKLVMRDLAKSGVVERAYLGAIVRNHLIDDTVIDRSTTLGRVVIANIVVESPAHRAGLKLGDLIVRADGKAVRNDLDLKKIMAQKKPGSVLALDLQRGQQGRSQIRVPLGTTPKADDLPADKDLL